MSADAFLDTNILIYAYDSDAGPKHERARQIVSELWEADGAVLSTQVLHEFYVNVTQKIPRPLPLATARRLVEQYMAWQVEVNGPDSTLRASEIQERYQLSFWDALIVAAACRGRVRTLLSEDLSPGRIIEGILVENPFLP
jgi:predicted nucleic acid-binding protein